MTTKKNLVKSMLMSAATAGIFSFSFVFTSCNKSTTVRCRNPTDCLSMIS